MLLIYYYTSKLCAIYVQFLFFLQTHRVGTASMITSDAEIRGDLEWQVQGDWSLKDQSEPTFFGTDVF